MGPEEGGRSRDRDDATQRGFSAAASVLETLGLSSHAPAETHKVGGGRSLPLRARPCVVDPRHLCNKIYSPIWEASVGFMVRCIIKKPPDFHGAS